MCGDLYVTGAPFNLTSNISVAALFTMHLVRHLTKSFNFYGSASSCHF